MVHIRILRVVQKLQIWVETSEVSSSHLYCRVLDTSAHQKYAVCIWKSIRKRLRLSRKAEGGNPAVMKWVEERKNNGRIPVS